MDISTKSEGFRADDEVYSPDGSVQPQYQAIVSVLVNLSDERQKAFEAQTREETLGFRTIRAMPRVLPQTEIDRIRLGASQRARALQALTLDLISGCRDFETKGLIPGWLIDGLLDQYSSRKWLKNLTPERLAFVYGPDVVFGQSRSGSHTYVLEDGIGNLGGLGDATTARKRLLDLIPEYKSVVNHKQGAPISEGMVKLWRKMATPGNGELVFFVPKESMWKNLMEVPPFEALGVHVVVSDDPSRFLQTESDGVFLVEADPDSGVVKSRTRVGLIMPKDTQMSAFARIGEPSLISLADAGQVALGFRPGLNFLRNKKLTPFIESMIRFYLGEEPLLKAAPTLFFTDPQGQMDQGKIETVFENIKDYVIKGSEGLAGKSVWIGNELLDVEIQELRQMVEISPQEFLAQERLTISTMAGWMVDLRPFVYVSHYGVAVADHLWGRTVPSGKLNISQTGKVTPVFSF